jgi:hypothetical protein
VAGVLFALLAGGVLLGFVGVVIAVPVAAMIGVPARFAIARYKESALYRGKDTDPVRHGAARHQDAPSLALRLFSYIRRNITRHGPFRSCSAVARGAGPMTAGHPRRRFSAL